MRRFLWWMPALLIIGASCPTAGAAYQEKRKMVPEEGALQVVLLRHHSVRQDLKLTPREARKIHEFTERQWKEAQRVEEMPDEKDRDRRYEEMTRENERFLQETLTGEQKKRLDQITLQVAGLLWITRPGIAAELRLTPEQKEKAREAQRLARREMEELLHSESRRDRDAELRKLHETSKDRLLDILTDDQEHRFREMMGAPFHGRLRFDEPALIEEGEK